MRELPALYHPLDGTIGTIPVIIYAARDKNEGDATLAYGLVKENLFSHIKRLHETYPYLREGTFQVIFMWSLLGKRMADVWIFDEQAEEGNKESGALIRGYVFKEDRECGQTEGLASSITLPVLGAEAALRRDIVDLKRFIHSPDIYPAIPGLPLTPWFGEGE